MKTASKLVLGLAMALVVGFVARAEEKKADKEVTLKGKITCAKCDLKLDGVTKCATVIKVKEKDKDVVYWFDMDNHKKYHSDICTEPKDGSVTGTVTEKDKKKWIKVTKLEYKDK